MNGSLRSGRRTLLNAELVRTANSGGGVTSTTVARPNPATVSMNRWRAVAVSELSAA